MNVVDIETMITKICTKCKTEKPISEFGKHRHSKDGFAYRCKECARKNSKRWSKTPQGIFKTIKQRVLWHESHSTRRGTPKIFSILKEDFINWYNSEPKTCAYCSIPEEFLSDWDDSHNNKAHRLTVDCIDNQLGYARGNLVLACLRCNGIKSDIFDHETMREIGQKYIRPIWEKEVTKANEYET